jgi:hypothetical protein
VEQRDQGETCPVYGRRPPRPPRPHDRVRVGFITLRTCWAQRRIISSSGKRALILRMSPVFDCRPLVGLAVERLYRVLKELQRDGATQFDGSVDRRGDLFALWNLARTTPLRYSWNDSHTSKCLGRFGDGLSASARVGFGVRYGFSCCGLFLSVRLPLRPPVPRSHPPPSSSSACAAFASASRPSCPDADVPLLSSVRSSDRNTEACCAARSPRRPRCGLAEVWVAVGAAPWNKGLFQAVYSPLCRGTVLPPPL